MSEGIEESNTSILQLKELKEKVRSLVSEVELNRENARFQPDEEADGNHNSFGLRGGDEDDYLDLSDFESFDESNWLTEENQNGESVEDICKTVYSTVIDDQPDVTALCQQLELSSIKEPNIFGSSKAPIDSRTFTRPKKYITRPSLTSVIDSGEDGRPKFQRRLTTTISPTPNLISKLEELSKTNNRPVSGIYSDLNWQDGSAEELAEMANVPARSKRQSLPASLFNRLQELKKANSSFKSQRVSEPSLLNGEAEDYGRHAILEGAKKVRTALNVDLKGSTPSRISEIFRNTQDYFSDDNESFFSLDEVSGFCDRLTLSTDQSTYSSIVKEMEQQEICLFHRNDENSRDKRLTFGGLEIPLKNSPKGNADETQIIDEEGDLNRTYEIEEEPGKANDTYEIKNTDKHNVMNRTYDADSKPGLVDVIMRSNIMENLSPNSLRETSIINNNTNNNNNNNNSNNNRLSNTCEGNNILSSTYDKFNGTLYQNELNAMRTEKYSTKIFDSSFRKSDIEKAKSPIVRSNGKKESDCSEDDCMSNTSDNSCRSYDGNADVKSAENVRSIASHPSKRYFSTPNAYQKGELHFGVVSPIRMEKGDGESRAFSNPCSRGASPRRTFAPEHSEVAQKHQMPNIRQPLKVPQRELKLKPAAPRPSQNRPFSSTRTSSEPSVPQKVENCQSTASVPVLKPSGLTGAPLPSNARPSSRTSGIPRPPTRLKQPQIRVNYSKK